MRLANLWWATAAAVTVSLAACSTGAAPTNAPTQVLIPAPPTLTMPAVIPSETPQPILAPVDVINPQTTPVDENLELLIQQMVDDLASSLNVEAEAVQVVRLESVFWMTSDLGCDVETVVASERGAGYRVILLVNNTYYEYHTDEGANFLRCEELDPTAAATLAIGMLLELDPVAAELAALAQQRIADQLDLPIRRIRIVDVRTVRWTDSSLGCPQPDQTYTQVETDGYRIVVSAGEQEYIFHSDFDRLLVCSADAEQLPED